MVEASTVVAFMAGATGTGATAGTVGGGDGPGLVTILTMVTLPITTRTITATPVTITPIKAARGAGENIVRLFLLSKVS